MKDVFRQEIEIGDQVATNISGYTYDLIVAEVTGFTPQKVRLVYKDSYNGKDVEILKFPRQIVIGIKNGLAGQEEKES